MLAGSPVLCTFGCQSNQYFNVDHHTASLIVNTSRRDERQSSAQLYDDSVSRSRRSRLRGLHRLRGDNEHRIAGFGGW